MHSSTPLLIAMAVLGSSSVLADTAPKSEKLAMAAPQSPKAIKPAELTCQDFLSYDEVTRPQIVYLSEGLNSKGKPEDAVIDIDRVNRLVPVLVEECTKEPQGSFWQKMKTEFKRVF